MYSYCMFMYFLRAIWHSSATLTEVFPCFFLSCKANARIKPAKTGHGPHCSKILCCSMYCLFCVVLCTICVEMCSILLPPAVNPIAVDKYISYHIIHIKSYIMYRIISYTVSYHIYRVSNHIYIYIYIIPYHISYHIPYIISSYHIIYHISYHHIISYHISYHHILYHIPYPTRRTFSATWLCFIRSYKYICYVTTSVYMYVCEICLCVYV